MKITNAVSLKPLALGVLFSCAVLQVHAESSMARQKRHETARDWSACIDQAIKNVRAAALAPVHPWVALGGLNCALALGQGPSERERALLEAIDKNETWLLQGPWALELQEDYYQLKLRELKMGQTSLSEGRLESVFQSLVTKPYLLNPARTAEIWEIRARYFEQKLNIPEALLSYELSLASIDSKEVRARYEKLFSSFKNAQVEVKEPRQNPITKREEELIQRIESLEAASASLQLLEELVRYLKNFPAGVQAKNYSEQWLRVATRLVDSQEQLNSNQREALRKALGGLNPARWGELLIAIHRRFDFKNALWISDLALSSIEKESLPEVVLYIAGRSAQQVGAFEKAVRFFEQYEELFSQGENLSEVVFRKGLSLLRLEQYSRARESFEKLLLLQGNERYELSARYYLVRCLEQLLAASKNESLSRLAENHRKEIISKFPFSYFALRLKAEEAKFFTWPASLDPVPLVSQEEWLSEVQRPNYRRIQLLAKEGWNFEAQREAQRLFVPAHPHLAALMVSDLAKLKIYPPLVRLVSIAGDGQSSLRHPAFVGLSFPTDVTTNILQESERSGISSVLVLGLIRQESAFFNMAQSSANAMGLMQLLGSTAREVSKSLNWKNFDPRLDLFNPQSNVRLGVTYLSRLLRSYNGNVPLALAAYNAGPGRVAQFRAARELGDLNNSKWQTEIWFDEFPLFETSFYIKAILRNAILYQLLASPDFTKVEFRDPLWQNLYQRK